MWIPNKSSLLRKVYFVVFLLFVVGLTFFYYSHLLEGNYLEAGYPDWINQVYRVDYFRNFGLTSWTYRTGNGQDMWQAFQFVPHALIATYANYFSLTTSVATLQTTFIGLFILYISAYLVFIKNTRDAFISFVLTLAFFATPKTLFSIREVSIFVGLVCAPALIFLVYSQKRWVVFFQPLILGLALYIHPILGFYCAGLWVLELLLNTNLRVWNKIFSFIIFLLVAAYYWAPAFFYNGTYYMDDYQVTIELIRGLLNMRLYGLSYTLLYILICTLIIILAKRQLTNIRTPVRLLYNFGLFLWIVLSFRYSFTPFINQFQITRWVPFIVIGILITLSVELSSIKYKRVYIYLLLVGILVFVAENFDAKLPTSLYRHMPQTRELNNSALDVFISENQIQLSSFDKVYITSPSEVVYFNKDVSTENEYFHFSQNKLRMYRINLTNYTQMYPNAINHLLNYFYIKNTRFVIFETSDPISTYLQQAGLKPTLVNHNNNTYYVFDLPVSGFKTALIDKTPSIFKETSFVETSNAVSTFRNILENPNNVNIAGLNFVSQNVIELKNIPPKSMIVINHNYDKNWVSNNSQISVTEHPLGFLMIQNYDTKSADTTTLTRQAPTVYKNSLFLVAAGVLLCCMTLIIGLCSRVFSYIRGRYRPGKSNKIEPKYLG